MIILIISPSHPLYTCICICIYQYYNHVVTVCRCYRNNSLLLFQPDPNSTGETFFNVSISILMNYYQLNTISYSLIYACYLVKRYSSSTLRQLTFACYSTPQSERRLLDPTIIKLSPLRLVSKGCWNR